MTVPTLITYFVAEETRGDLNCSIGAVWSGMQAELILGVVARQERKVEEGSEKPYLQQRVEYSEGKLLDEENKGVMMAWENPLMAAHAKAICANGGHALNVGFGMGLVDTAIQGHNPASHTIIEAHPEVYKRMLETGWGEKPNVRILFGRWQDVLSQLDSYDGKFLPHVSPLQQNAVFSVLFVADNEK